MENGAEIFERPLPVTGRTTVTGDIRAGAHLDSGSSLLVYGNAQGDFFVGDDAQLIVQGSFLGNIRRNAGLVMLYGYVETILGESSGNVVVGVESVISDGTSLKVLRPDGSTEILDSTTDRELIDTHTNMKHVCVFDPETNGFRSLPPGTGGPGDQSAPDEV